MRPQDPKQSEPQLDPRASTSGSNRSQQQESSSGGGQGQQQPFFQPPSVNLPKGGGAIQGIGEKFQANPVTGTGSMSVPIAMSPGRGGFTPQLALSYDSGAGNSPFGLGWNIGLASISRKTSKGLPQYDGLPKYYDEEESDVFLLSGAEDLIPKLDGDHQCNRTEGQYAVHCYIPRIEGLFARIERWTHEDGDVHWRSISRENITTIYGRTPAARIFDPAQPWKIFSWLIEKSYDDKGNILCYEYKKEDGVGTDGLIYEKNRTAYAQTYLKRVLYGNTVPFQPLRASFDLTHFNDNNQWLFELVLDYGEHANAINGHPEYEESQDWALRQDPYSSYRSGFEVRTYRLCQRLLMYHHMPEQLGVDNYLVKATHLSHQADPIATQLESVQHTGYMLDDAGAYQSKSYPAVKFKYTTAKVDHTVYEINDEDLPNVPQGIDGQQYQFVDLYQEGVNGILSQRNAAWYYKENLGGGQFGPQRQVATLPSPALAGAVQLTDYEGNGRMDAVIQNGTLNGYYELDENDKWSNFRSFPHPLSIPLNDPNARPLDLNGDGIADLLLTENDCFVYYASEAKDGYKAARRVAKMLDEEQGPRIVFNEAFQTVFLSDMSGDGMTDIVRIRNGEVCYWPNLGYGRFGAKVTMANAPHFDQPDYYDPSRLRLVDVNGTGTIDILYLGRNEVRYWLNASGNAWVEQEAITSFPTTTQLHNVSTFDLLADGTACLVWSSPLPGQSRQPLKYIRLMGETPGECPKPYLLRETDNQMGAITRLKYAPSTKFYLADKAVSKPWITRLPFVVQVLERQEVYEAVAGNHFVSRYAYHHGYFDSVEREFRGFGMVEQWDTEDYLSLQENTLFAGLGTNWSEQTDVPPIYTKSWFHNGYWQQGGKITRQYEQEYYQDDAAAWLLTDTELPAGLTTQEQREAARALKGSILRVETYGLDDSPHAAHPYTVAETKYHLKTIQSQGANRHASFYRCNCETLTYQYERNPNDPRIAHQSTLEVDQYGQVLKAVSVVYPRRAATDYAEQKKCYATLTEADFLHLDQANEFLRLDLPLRQSSYELLNLQVPAGRPFSKDELIALSLGNRELLAQSLITYNNEECTAELPSGEAAYHGIPFQAQEAVATEAQLINAYDYGTANARVDANMLTEAGYQQQGSLFYRYSGKVDYDLDRFFLPVTNYDPLSGQSYHVQYDDYAMVAVNTNFEFLGHTIAASGELDYRTLQPVRMTDPNGNQQSVVFDALGMVVATAVAGKNGEGDTLDNYQLPQILNTDMRAVMYNNPHDYLQDATSFFYYDLNAWRRDEQPNYALSIVRETHVSELSGTPSKTQINFSYSDGLGQTIMVKVQAEAGDAYDVATDSMLPANPRWVGNGRTVFNNKGKPVKQYEPYFSHNFDYETESVLVEFGVTPILHYDAVGRNIRTDLPDGTFTKVEFTPWEQKTFDQNDTILESDWYVQNGSPLPTDSEPSVAGNNPDYGKRAAWLAAQYANTPKVELLDTLGRVFLLIDDDGSAHKVKTHFKLDLLDNQLEVTDAKDRLISRNHFNLVNEPMLTESIDAGRRWSLTNILGSPLYSWTDRNFRTRMTYDELQRNTSTYIQEGTNTEQLVYLMVYGEKLTDPALTNHFGQVYQLYDQAGCKTTVTIDFKGNPLEGHQQVCVDYKNTIDWSLVDLTQDAATIYATASALLESEVFTTSSEVDALNRPLTTTAPDGSETHYTYNEANFLEKIETRLRGATTLTDFVKNVDYDAKGQRTRIRYGNGVTTTYEYDPNTFRLIRLKSTRSNDNAVLQDLQYHYDPVGNITDMRDDAQQTIYFNNSVVAPHSSYTYDALYRIIKAQGREHIGQTTPHHGQNPNDYTHYSSIPHANDSQAMQSYTRRYEYDELGNIQIIRHNSGSNGWSRTYEYNEASFLEATKKNNRLSKTILSNSNATQTYTHDIHGNMTIMPHLPSMTWDFADQLKEVNLGSGGQEYYTYTIGGGKDFGVRTRKVTEKAGGKICDRIYLGDYEVYREQTIANGIELERETLHIQDDKGRIALVDTLAIENGTPISPSGGLPANSVGGAGGAVIRFQLSNHLDSASLELDDNADLISYEEYYPFGASSYRAGRSATEVALKRYRYVGKERDENTGLDYYGARYYGSWLGRWCSADPAGFVDGYNLFLYALNNPIRLNDPDGMFAKPGYGDKSTGSLNINIYFQKDDDISDEEFEEYTTKFIQNVESFWNSGSLKLKDGTTVNTNDVVYNSVSSDFDKSELGSNGALIIVGKGSKLKEIDEEKYGDKINNNTSFIEGNWGYMFFKSTNNASEAAHEFGHLFGLSDRYHEILEYDNASNDAFDPNKRNTVAMSESMFRQEKDFDSSTNLFSGGESTLTEKQLKIVFNRFRLERQYPTVVIVEDNRSANAESVEVKPFTGLFSRSVTGFSTDVKGKKRKISNISWAKTTLLGTKIQGFAAERGLKTHKWGGVVDKNKKLQKKRQR
jgi:RHS repeat-associated protein